MKKLNILVIDNDSHYKQRLKDLLKAHNTTIIGHDEVRFAEPEQYDLIVLSGGGIPD